MKIPTAQNQTKDCQQGGVIVEAASTISVFFFLLLVFLEVILSTYNWALVQFSMDRIARDSAVRLARTPADIEQAIIARVQRLGLGVELQPEDISICSLAAGRCTTHAPQSRGAGGGIFLVRIRHQLDFSFSPWSANVEHTLFVRNEPR